MKKRAKQLDHEVKSALARHSTKRKLPADLGAAFADMVDDAEVSAAENLFLGRRDLGYSGDPKEFRFSQIFGRHFPGAKYDRLVEIIEEFSQHPHGRLGRKLTAREAERLGKEALRILSEDRALYRGEEAP